MGKVDFTQRNVAIDILRALTMLLMIFVNDLWRIRGEPEWLGHATKGQDFLGLADIVLPCFLFSVGMSIPFALESRFNKNHSGVSILGHILSRTFTLLIMGVFLVNTESGISKEIGMTMPIFRILLVSAFILIWNVYPKTQNPSIQKVYTGMKAIGVLLLIYLGFIFRDSSGGVLSARWWGILGMIGWAYVICAIAYLFTRDRLKYLIAFLGGLLLICALRTNTVYGEALLNLPRGNFLDDFLSAIRIGNGSSASFVAGGMVFSLLSVKYSHIVSQKRLLITAAIVAALVVAGYVSNYLWIISKLTGGLPWIFYCMAIAVGTYGVVYWLDEKGKAGWFDVIKPAGTATLTCYLMPYVLYSLLSLFKIKFPAWMLTGTAGILNMVAFAFLTIGVTYLLGRIRIKLKV